MITDRITAIKKQIVAKLEKGEDVSELSRQLAEERAKIASQAEVEELKKIAEERQALKNKAETIKERVQKQDEAINRFLKLRDTLISQLQPLREPMKELSQMQTMQMDGPGECYAGYNDIGQFAGDARQVPADYFDKNFGCPFLAMKDGLTDARGKAQEAYNYFVWSIGILSSFEKHLSQLNLAKAEGLIAIEPESNTGSCNICLHSEVETINNLLRQGKSLRDIEAEFGVSRSTLSRHKNHIMVERESPTASSNQTFFKG